MYVEQCYVFITCISIDVKVTVFHLVAFHHKPPSTFSSVISISPSLKCPYPIMVNRDDILIPASLDANFLVRPYTCNDDNNEKSSSKYSKLDLPYSSIMKETQIPNDIKEKAGMFFH